MSEKKYPSKMNVDELVEELESAGTFPPEGSKKPALVELVTELRGAEKPKRKKSSSLLLKITLMNRTRENRFTGKKPSKTLALCHL